MSKKACIKANGRGTVEEPLTRSLHVKFPPAEHSMGLFCEVEGLEISLTDFTVAILIPEFNCRLRFVIRELEAELGQEVLYVPSRRRIPTLGDKLPRLIGFVVKVLIVNVLELLKEGREVDPARLTSIGDSDELGNLLRGGGASKIFEGLLELRRLDGASLVVIEKSEGLFELLDLILRQVSHNVRHDEERGEKCKARYKKGLNS